MSRCKAIILLCLPLSICASTLHAQMSPLQALRRNIQALLPSETETGLAVGIEILSLSKGETIFSHRASDLFDPASNTKILSTAAALSRLGPYYTFRTQVYVDQEPSVKGVLKGNCYIKGFGDPVFVSEELWYMIKELRKLGIEEITGDLILDDTFFSLRGWLDEWGKINGSRAYEAPLGALSLNFNTVAVDVGPGRKSGAPVQVSIDPNSIYLNLHNKAVTGEKEPSTLSIVREGGRKENTIRLSGMLSLSRERKRFYRSITDPLLYFGHTFVEFAQKEGILIRGKINKGEVPVEAVKIYEHDSRPLRTIIADLNKLSNNFIAEQILMVLGSEMIGPPASPEKGLRAVETFLTELGIKPGTYILADGSGFSPRNRLSPHQIVAVLEAIYRDFKVGPEFVSSLGISGADGTLKKRMSGPSLKGFVRGKTGHRSGVSSLAGYAQSRDGEVFAFSILFNSSSNNIKRSHALQDAIISRLAHFSRYDGKDKGEENVKSNDPG